MRYWLFAAGYDVQMSEHNDFDRADLDTDAFASCLDNVATSDHYIVLMGKRRGTWFDESNRVSVTRQEFRTAVAAESTRPIGITVLVRKEIDVAVKQWEKDGAPAAKSDFVDDPAFTAEFLAEASQPPQGAKGPRWYYTFSDFRDIVDALRILLRIDTNLEKRLLEQALTDEILGDLSLLVGKSKESATIIAQHRLALSLVQRRTIQIPNELAGGGRMRIGKDILLGHAMMMFSLPRAPLQTEVMREALQRGLFREYDPASGTIVDTVEHEALSALREDVQTLEAGRSSEYTTKAIQTFFQLWHKYKKAKDGVEIVVDADDLTIILSVYDRLDDVYGGLAAFAKWLLGSSESPEISRHPISPVEGMAAAIEAERVTPAELRWAIVNDVHPFGVKLTPHSRKLAHKMEEGLFKDLRVLVPKSRANDKLLKKIVSETVDKAVIEGYRRGEKTSKRVKR